MGNAVTYALDGAAPAGLDVQSGWDVQFDPKETYKHLGLGESTVCPSTSNASDGQGTDGIGTETITRMG